MLGSPVDLALIGGVALLVFGPKKLPEMGRSLGLGLASFKNALNQSTESETKNTETKTSGNNATETKIVTNLEHQVQEA